MVIYIKENEIITELYYNEENILEFNEKGFQPVEVPDVDEPSSYRYSDFENKEGVWQLKVI
jgi:hypothetical protein